MKLTGEESCISSTTMRLHNFCLPEQSSSPNCGAVAKHNCIERLLNIFLIYSFCECFSVQKLDPTSSFGLVLSRPQTLHLVGNGSLKWLLDNGPSSDWLHVVVGRVSSNDMVVHSNRSSCLPSNWVCVVERSCPPWVDSIAPSSALVVIQDNGRYRKFSNRYRGAGNSLYTTHVNERNFTFHHSKRTEILFFRTVSERNWPPCKRRVV